MAKITLDLNRFKASGVYTLEFDASERIVVTTQTIRLVVGFSRKGPFNAPVFLRDVATARKVFGNVDAFLEKRGSFFHRALEICLQTAPVFGLNLLPLNDAPVNEGGDAVEYRSFALSASEENGNTTRALISSFYNKERFWFPDTTYLQATVDSKPLNKGRLFNFVNLGQEVQSVIIRKSENVPQYNVTADDYYGRGEVPIYIYPNDYLADYFVDVYVVKGDWTNLPLLSQDPLYSKYFDLRGVKADKFFEFLSLDGITLTGSFTGSIIPDFVDNNGSNQSIDTIVNSAVALTGIFCNLNKDAFSEYENSLYKVDMVGNSLISTTDDILDFLSYNTPIKALLQYEGEEPVVNAGSLIGFDPKVQDTDPTVSPIPYVKSYPFGGDKGKFNNVLVIPKPYPVDTTFTVSQYEALLAQINRNSLIKTYGLDNINNSILPNDFVKVANIIDTGSSVELHLSTPLHTNNSYLDSNNEGYPEADYIWKSTTALVPTVANRIPYDAANGAPFALLAGQIILVEAPGYAKYFEISDVIVDSPESGINSIEVKDNTTTGTGLLTIGGPYFQSKYCVDGFSAEEFAAYLQPSDIKITVFDTDNGDSELLIPDLELGQGNGIGYILEPNVFYSKIDGLGQTQVISGENAVALEYLDVPPSPGLATWVPIQPGTYGMDSWHIVDDLANDLLAYDIKKWVYDATPGIETWVDNPDFKSVRIVGDNNGVTNPFQGNDVGDLIRVTLPNGQQFYGEVGVDVANVPGDTYNLVAADQSQDNAGVENSIASLAIYEAYPGTKLAKNIATSIVVDGDGIKYGVGSSQYNFLNVSTNWNLSKSAYTKIHYGLSGAKLEQFATSNLLTRADDTYADINLSFIADEAYDVDAPGIDYISIFSSRAKNIQEGVTIDAPGIYGGGKKFKVTGANADAINVGDYVVNNDINNPVLVRVTNKAKKLDTVTGLPFFEITVLDTPLVTTASGISKVTKFTPIQKFCDRYQFTKLSGFKLTDFHLPGTPSQLEKIYGVIENTNLGITLADKDVITFRYIVDTFNGGLVPNMGPKQILSRLAKNRQKCMALINAPSIKEFINSTDPRFTELPDPNAGNPKPVLNTEYIGTGGNLTLGPSFVWRLPDEDQGAKFMGVFSPNIIIRESNKEISIPPAADVSNNFIRKFINGEPYGIVAGPRRGVISNPKFVKLEYDYLLRDREYLEPVGINPITVVKNVGPMIFANQTAYQRTVSAFNNLHVRDLLITITEAIEEILQNFLFEFNDATTRLEIRSIVETYLDTVRTAGGVFDFSVIMDDTNNTPAIIDQNFGIIDIGIEPARGIQKFINRITILKTGAISSGGFTAA